MKKSTIAIVILMTHLSLNASSQVIEPSIIHVPTYETSLGTVQQCIIPMAFGITSNIHFDKRSLPSSAEVIAVDVVFSEFPKGSTFLKTNTKRAEFAKKLFPQLNNKNIFWQLVGQTECNTKEEAETLFHGVVVHYRVPPTEESMKKEIAFLNELFSSTVPKKEVDYKKTLGGVSTITSSAIVSSDNSSKSASFEFIDTMATSWELSGAVSKPGNYRTDFLIAKVMDRNLWPTPNIVADVTGSMSPYTGQLLTWLSLHFNDKLVKSVTFFNDGDRQPDSRKKIGETGGIYQTNTPSIVAVRNLASVAMSAGYGGDVPENNIEALIKAAETFPNSKELILVADAIAPIKDISLVDKINVPVRVILCGSYYGVHPSYFELAYKTGGSLHTIEEDILSLIQMKDGEIVHLSGRNYKLVNGTFVYLGHI